VTVEPANRYRDGVTAGRQVLGAFCCLDGYSLPHILAAVGFDFLVFDRQHAAYSWPELEQMCFRARAAGASTFIRVASSEEAEINLALDLPVDGIVIPNVTSADEARRARRFAKFPPEGERSAGNERHAATRDVYDLPEPLVGLLIEHRLAVEAIDEILKLSFDFVWVGTHDLAYSMGLEPQDAVGGGELAPALAAAVARVQRAAAAQATPYWEPASDEAAIGIAGVDARIVRQAAEQALARWRPR
jgi:4-hydroxy-2-oxoheptanedioate aldolase